MFSLGFCQFSLGLLFVRRNVHSSSSSWPTRAPCVTPTAGTGETSSFLPELSPRARKIARKWEKELVNAQGNIINYYCCLLLISILEVCLVISTLSLGYEFRQALALPLDHQFMLPLLRRFFCHTFSEREKISTSLNIV